MTDRCHVTERLKSRDWWFLQPWTLVATGARRNAKRPSTAPFQSLIATVQKQARAKQKPGRETEQHHSAGEPRKQTRTWSLPLWAERRKKFQKMERMGDFIHVSADQVNAIGSALASAGPNSTLVLGAGVYRETNPLIIRHEGISIISQERARPDGCHATGILASSIDLQASPLLQVACSRFQLHNISIELLTKGDDEAEQCVKAASKDCKMRRCCMILEGCGDITFDSCRIACNGGIGLEIASHATGPILNGCVISSCIW
jgi:hypothetical protein